MRETTDRDTARAFCLLESALIRERNDPELLRLLRVAHGALQEVRNLGWERYSARHDQRPLLTMRRTTIDDGLRVLEYHGRRDGAAVARAGRQLAVASEHCRSQASAGDVLPALQGCVPDSALRSGTLPAGGALMAHTSDRDRLPEVELLKLHGLRITVEPYPNGIRALAVYKGDDRLYHGEPQGARAFTDGYDVGKSEPVEHADLDPRLTDLDLLRAARSILEERGQDTENLSSAIWAMTCGSIAGRAE